VAKANLKLIHAIRNTARKLKQNVSYQWGHMGSCNCGHLAQEITQLSGADIHKAAMRGEGSWTDQSRTYLSANSKVDPGSRVRPLSCATSGLSMDLLISILLDVGLEIKDLEYLEKLSDPKVLKYLGTRSLRYNQREHVVLYLEAWADLLENKLLSGIPVVNLEKVLNNELINS